MNNQKNAKRNIQSKKKQKTKKKAKKHTHIFDDLWVPLTT